MQRAAEFSAFNRSHFLKSQILSAALVFVVCACDSTQPGDDVDTTHPAEQALSLPASGYFKVPDGHYVGSGTWTDTTGKSGTLSDVTTLNSLTNTETVTYSDGLVISQTIAYVEQGGSQYNVTTTVNGQTFVVGSGACSQNQCQTSETTPAFAAFESSQYATVATHKSMLRTGAFQDKASNVWRFYRIAESAP
jgi:hypothetical protein